MENMRLLLLVSLGFVGLLLWQAWQKDYAPEQPSNQETYIDQSNVTGDADSEITRDDLPEAVTTDETPPVRNETEGTPGKRIIVETDVYSAEIDTYGGDLRKIALKQYPISSDQPQIPYVLLEDSKGQFYASQGGLLSKQSTANHHTIYQSEKNNYALAEGEDSVDIVLSWSDENVHVEKIFTFHRNNYLFETTYRVKNLSDDNWNGRVYEQLHRKHSEEARKMLPTFTGAAISTPEKRYEKIKFDDMEESPVSRESSEGWAAMLQHYFVSALIPEKDQTFHYYSKVLNGDHYIIGLYGPQFTVEPGSSAERKMSIYSGPKSQKVLEKIAPGLELTVDYGVLWFIAKPLYWLLDKMHSLSGNWGWAIILVTILIKIFFYPLSAMGFKSMARMRNIQPRMLAIRDRYGKDKARLNQAMMELYKQEKINPLGGCFPILIQIPVFLALYWVLLETVEIRQAPFMLWIRDLSIADPYFVLPVIMGASMFVQQKLNPAPMDPVQAKVMQFLPIIFTGFFAFFPAGLVLYWVVNNILSIAQQWMITRQIEGPKKTA